MSTNPKPTSKARGRPRKDPNASETRQRLIRAGLIHLTERGYSSVGVDEILLSSGVPKGSFYHYFRNKADFGSALIGAYNTYFLQKLDRAFADLSLPPLDRLHAFIQDAQAGMARHGYRRGCLVGNLGQEMAALPEEFRGQLKEALEQWQDRVARCLSEAQTLGALAVDQDTRALAAFFWIGWEGAVLRAKLEHSPEPLHIFVDGFFASLKP